MEHKKDIGKAFRDKLDLLDKTPGDHVWNAIAADLPKKKKRRLLPFWLTFISIAVTILLFVVVIGDFGTDASRRTPVRTTEKPNEQPENQHTSDSDAAKENAGSQNPENTNIVEDGQTGSGNIKNQTGAPTTEHHHPSSRENYSEIDGNNILDNDPKRTLKKGKRTTAGKKLKSVSDSGKQSQSVAATKKQRIKKGKAKPSDSEIFSQTLKQDSEAHPNQADSLKTGTASETQPTTASEKTTSVTEKDSVAKAIADNKLKKKKKEQDTTKTVVVEENNYRTFSIFLYAAPTHFGHMDDRSSIDRVLDNATKSSEVIFNYGGYLSFIADEHWTVRFGVANTVLKMTTKDIDNATFEGQDFYGIDYNTGITNDYISQQFANADALDIEQELSYLEFPIEVKYKFLDKGIDIEGIGGVSTLFLKDNLVTVTDNSGVTITMGETRDMFKANVSIRVGLGLNYKFLENFQVNAEPIFRYHFKMGEVDQKPYSALLQAGIEYTFNSKNKKKK